MQVRLAERRNTLYRVRSRHSVSMAALVTSYLPLTHSSARELSFIVSLYISGSTVVFPTKFMCCLFLYNYFVVVCDMLR